MSSYHLDNPKVPKMEGGLKCQKKCKQKICRTQLRKENSAGQGLNKSEHTDRLFLGTLNSSDLYTIKQLKENAYHIE